MIILSLLFVKANKDVLLYFLLKAKSIYNGLTACVSDQHVHVECKEDIVAHLIEMAEPELSGLRQERHAKTIEIAQKEVLTCIGICLYERFQRIQQRLREGQQACDLLFYVALQSLKHSFEMAFESKQGKFCHCYLLFSLNFTKLTSFEDAIYLALVNKRTYLPSRSLK